MLKAKHNTIKAKYNELTKNLKDPAYSPLLNQNNPSLDAAYLKRFVRNVAKTDAYPQHVNQVLEILGLNYEGRLTDERKTEKLVNGITAFLHFHFGTEKDSDKKRADILVKSVFEEVLPKEVAVHAAKNIAVSVTSQAFNTVSILEVLDTKCGGLNNVAVSEYARIETMLGHTTLKRGRHLLPYRNRLTKVRKCADRLTYQKFNIENNRCGKFGDTVKLDFEKQLRYMLLVYGLTDRAKEGGVEWGISFDGADMTKNKKTQHCSFGYVNTDKEATDLNGKKLFYDWVTKEGGGLIRKFKNCQETSTCALAGMVGAAETKPLVKDIIAPFFKFHKAAAECLPCSGDEPALKGNKFL